MTAEFVYAPDDRVEATPGPTPSQTVGPFFHYALPYDFGPQVAGPGRPGLVHLRGRVLDGAGEPVPDALVELWQADEHGAFVTTPGLYAETTGSGFRGFGRCATDGEGAYAFRTVKPGPAPTADGEPQAPHVTLAVFARGMLRQVVTRAYFADEDAANASDPLLSALDARGRDTLVAEPGDDGYRFDVHLQGESETVFLDVFTR
jgi:protocatechuate 3,4-dioxygenase, alpha subunit